MTTVWRGLSLVCPQEMRRILRLAKDEPLMAEGVLDIHRSFRSQKMKYWTARLGVAMAYASTDNPSRKVPDESFDVIIRAEVDFDWNPSIVDITKDIISMDLVPEVNLVVFAYRRTDNPDVRKAKLLNMLARAT